jgi:ATP-dependent Clp protease ATP-binding subunit ClpA
MFERYTEKARRAIFFARYEASQFGRHEIETDFLLLGIIRENRALSYRWFGEDGQDVRKSVERKYSPLKRFSTSVDLPLSPASKRVLAYAAEESERLGHKHIGTEHLFLGLLREPDCLAAELLAARHVSIETVRKTIAKEPQEQHSGIRVAPPAAHNVRILNEEGSNLAALPWLGRIPSIGETLSIPDDKGVESIYRIKDLTWQIARVGASPMHVTEVLLKVRKESP